MPPILNTGPFILASHFGNRSLGQPPHRCPKVCQSSDELPCTVIAEACQSTGDMFFSTMSSGTGADDMKPAPPHYTTMIPRVLGLGIRWYLKSSISILTSTPKGAPTSWKVVEGRKPMDTWMKIHE